MIDKFKNAFREEAEELLAQLEGLLLELEENPSDLELLNATFRAVHTIKGSAGMFGFERISRFVHDFETVLDFCRSKRLTADKHIVDLFLESRDIVKTMLAEDNEKAPFSQEALRIIGEFKHIVDLQEDPAASVVPSPAAEKEPTEPPPATVKAGSELAADQSAPDSASTRLAPLEEQLECFRIFLKPGKEIFFSGTRVLKLVAELSELGEMQAYPRTKDIPSLEELNPEHCYVAWDIVLTTSKGINSIRDVFIFVEDAIELKIEKLDVPDAGSSAGNKKLGEILIERGIVKAEALGDALKSQRRLGEVLIESKLVTQAELNAALAEQSQLRKVQEKTTESVASIRVASEKLDFLVDLVGELVTLQARLAQTSGQLADSSLAAISEQLERLVAQLRDNAMSIRMLPIGSTFNKFKRVVRDLSSELGKDVELLTEGAETELDKTVLERLNDPLVHIIRNALDHGLETPDDRRAANKPPRGVLKLSAEHSGAHVVISISDDGHGMDMKAIHAKAVERGLIGAGEVLSEDDAFMLIFRPGFSTAKSLSSVSGRGVGMDVVKREIDALGGSVHVKSTQGAGTTINLKIPLTLAIIEGLLVRISQEYYVLPLSSVEACIELTKTRDENENEGRLMQYRGDLLPYIDLREFFAVPGDAPEVRQVVVVNTQNEKLGMVVDNVIGDYQTVIKPLGRMLRNTNGLSGATILGDGTVALIVDFARIAISARNTFARKAG
ncbi:MAG: chemotaxis protein CheA [Spirochaetes bacterium]|nr:chemotaxis protein CheA [Spirochaetota bacterium]MBU0955130.1 chemotaxis protein CheA [Spirochaetota bacterium]